MLDLLFFVCFIFIFLLAFSTTSWSLLTTNDQVMWNYNDDGSFYNYTLENNGTGIWSWGLLYNVTNYGVWKIFGQVDPISKDFVTFSFKMIFIMFFLSTGGADPYSAVAFVLAIIFLFIANVLLLSLLVALFKYEKKM
jgi:hypothetical protein